MTITIPAAALEAGADALWRKGFLEYRNLDAARAAFLAMLQAWPGMVDHPETAMSPRCLWLPLMENPDDKA